MGRRAVGFANAVTAGAKSLDRVAKILDSGRLPGEYGPGLLGRRPKLVTLGISPDAIKKANPAYRQALVNAKKYMLQRQKELFAKFGYVSSGVNQILSTAALTLAASRYIFELTTSGELDRELLTIAARLAAEARVSERAAWDLCKEEYRQRNHMAASVVPWLEDQNSASTAEEDTAEVLELELEESGATPPVEQKP